MASDLTALALKFDSFLADLEPVQHAVGMFGKETAIEQAERSLGAGASFSGWKSRVKLGAGYDLGNPVMLNLRPAGMWTLANEGRKRTKRILPKRRNGKKALSTPYGPKASAMSRPSRGLRTIDNTEHAIELGVVKAAEKGINDIGKRIFG